MSEGGTDRATKVAKALNEIRELNLHTAAAENVLIDLIDDFFVDDEHLSSDSDSSDSDSADEVVTVNVNSTDEAFVADPDLSESADTDDRPGPAIAHGVGLHDGVVGDDTYVDNEQYDSDDSQVDENEINVVMEQVDFVNPDTQKELELIENFRCECTRRGKNLENKKSCSSKLDKELIARVRMEMSALTDNERDLVLIAKISTLSNFSEMTKRSKRTDNKRRQHQKTVYMMEGQEVCRDTFRFVHKLV